jgi:hypothetical protein
VLAGGADDQEDGELIAAVADLTSRPRPDPGQGPGAERVLLGLDDQGQRAAG